MNKRQIISPIKQRIATHKDHIVEHERWIAEHQEKIADLEHALQVIQDEWASNGNSGSRRQIAHGRKRKKISRNGESNKEYMYSWLQANGPAMRSEIIDGTGLPRGTVGGYLSTQKDLFEKRKDGLWYAL